MLYVHGSEPSMFKLLVSFKKNPINLSVIYLGTQLMKCILIYQNGGLKEMKQWSAIFAFCNQCLANAHIYWGQIKPNIKMI